MTDYFVRALDERIGTAVARRTVFRKSDNDDWSRVAARVALGNGLCGKAKLPAKDILEEVETTRRLISSGVMITSGRHLQHGDADQPMAHMERFTNCSTSITSYGKFLLLLNGSGVGRSYDDQLMVVNWNKAPPLVLLLDPDHADYPKTDKQLIEFGVDFGVLPFGTSSLTPATRNAVLEFKKRVIKNEATYGPILNHVIVEDSREGWAKAFEAYETYAYDGVFGDKELVIDFSAVRPKGAPIGGMQNRPASGPLSVMRAFWNIDQKVRPVEMPLWKQAMHVDHYLSVEVQVGGARRAARMSTKDWRDPGAMEFIKIKAEGGLWTSNNSLMVDKAFWSEAKAGKGRAYELYRAAIENMYINGEPGFINGDKLEMKGRPPVSYFNQTAFGSSKYQTTHAAGMLRELEKRADECRFPYTTNPCGEIVLSVVGGFCVIADVAPILGFPYATTRFRGDGYSDSVKHQWDSNVEEAIRATVRFLMRVNQMESVYHQEVERTQRIGVSLTGIHEYAWARYGFGFRDLIDEEKSIEFWKWIGNLSDQAKAEAVRYAEVLGVSVPHTVTTIKPAGTTSKLYSLSEGAHLPARRQYIRWVQYRGQKQPDGTWPADADPLLAEYEAAGYPVKALKTFDGMSVVGFPTSPLICNMGMGDKLVTAAEATPEEQYQWIKLLEKWWIGEHMGNQVSYTMKIDTSKHSLEDFSRIVLEHQPEVRCCTILPTSEAKMMTYEYLPEEDCTVREYNTLCRKIGMHDSVVEDVDLETLACENGVCPL